MRIQVKGEGHVVNLFLPTGLLFNPVSARIACHYIRKYAPGTLSSISPEAIKVLCAELRRIKKKYGKWDLVDIQSADGERVLIRL